MEKKTLIAEIFSTGTELLLGEVVDTNAAYLSQRLREKGIFVYRRVTVGDNLLRLSHELKDALERVDIVIISGGLGPTDDDITREAIAEAVGETPSVNEALLEEIKQMFASRNKPMPANNTKQAWLIPSAEAIHNAVGTAPGWFVNKGDKIIIALPGPPHELKKMWEELTEKLLPQSSTVLYSRMIHTAGTSESYICELIKDFTKLDNPGIGTYSKPWGIDIRVAASAATEAEAKIIAEPVIEKIEAIIKPWIYGYDQDTIVSGIKNKLIASNQTVCTIESLTGGILASRFTDCPGISACFKGGIVSYSNEIKELSGVKEETIKKYGAVSAETAAEMAESAKKLMHTDWALSTTGAAGPEPLEGHPAGTAYIGLAGPQGVSTELVNWPGTRDSVRNRVVRTALQKLLTSLQE